MANEQSQIWKERIIEQSLFNFALFGLQKLSCVHLKKELNIQAGEYVLDMSSPYSESIILLMFENVSF